MKSRNPTRTASVLLAAAATFGLAACGGLEALPTEDGAMTDVRTDDETGDWTQMPQPYLGEGGPLETGVFEIDGQRMELRYERIGGEAVFQGDIILPEPPDPTSAATAPTDKGLGRRNSSYRWPNGIIPYVIDPGMVRRDHIQSSIDAWHENTGIRWVPRTNQRHYVEFLPASNAVCQAEIGRQPGDPSQTTTTQYVKLGPFCGTPDALHETSHTVGLMHEHSRPDRDQYLDFLMDNVKPGYEGIFTTTIDDTGLDYRAYGAYDVDSITHYSSMAASKNGEPTMLKTDGTQIPLPRRLSRGDRQTVRAMYGFTKSNKWHNWFAPAGTVPMTGDFDGDGRDDIIYFMRSLFSDGRRGMVIVALSTGQTFGAGRMWHREFCLDDEVCKVGDVNGDGRDDIIAFERGRSGDVYVALSYRSRFGRPRKWHGSFCYGDEVCEVGDVDGDRKADIVAFVRSTKRGRGKGDVWVSRSNGQRFGRSKAWHGYFCVGQQECRVADVTGDGKADLITFIRNTKTGAGHGDVRVAKSNGRKFGRNKAWHGRFCVGDETCRVADVNGDGRADAVAFVRSTRSGSKRGDVRVSLSTGSKFSNGSKRWHKWHCLGSATCDLGDFDGNGLADIASFTGGTSADVWVAR